MYLAYLDYNILLDVSQIDELIIVGTIGSR